MSLAVTHQFAPCPLQFPDEGLPLHTFSSTGSCLAVSGAGASQTIPSAATAADGFPANTVGKYHWIVTYSGNYDFYVRC